MTNQHIIAVQEMAREGYTENRDPKADATWLHTTLFGELLLRQSGASHLSNVLLFQPPHPRHTVKAAGPGAIAGEGEFWCVGGHFGHKDAAQRAMGIDWMADVKEIANAIPPAYTRWIGEQLMRHVQYGRELPA